MKKKNSWEIEDDEETIFSDYWIIKNEIWENWYPFQDNLSDLLMYPLTGKYSEKVHLSTIKYFYRTYLRIGKPRFQKFLSDQEFKDLNSIVEVYHDSQKVAPELLIKAQEIIANFLTLSGMDVISKKLMHPSKAVRVNR